MPVILVLEDDGATRDALAETLRRLFPGTRVLATRADAEPEVVEREGASVVLAGLSTAERLCRRGACPGARVVALTREMGPDTLMRAEALGVSAALRAPTSAARLEAVLGPMLGAAAEAGTSVDRAV
ncbi:MAG TPA: hypothetical protein VET45_18275 [Candidatus Binatia bacterium]|nr:hypothetical protein [Candidatus Binatia bacterium]